MSREQRRELQGVVQKLHRGSAKIAQEVVQKLHEGSAKIAPNNIIYNIVDNIVDNILSREQKIYRGYAVKRIRGMRSNAYGVCGQTHNKNSSIDYSSIEDSSIDNNIVERAKKKEHTTKFF